MKYILALIFSLALAAAAFADEPANSYINDMLQGTGDNVWWVYPKEIDGQTITPPKGGYIFRFKIDMNSDGVDEVFLTSDIDVAKDGQTWTLYRRDGSGNYAKLNDNIWLNGLLWAKTENGVKKYSYVTPQAQDSGLESISAFWIDASGAFETSTQQLTEAQSKAINGGDQSLLDANGLPDDNKIAQYLHLGDPITLNIQKALVGKLYQNSSATWRAVNGRFTLSQQYLDPADATDIASLANWNPPPSPLTPMSRACHGSCEKRGAIHASTPSG